MWVVQLFLMWVVQLLLNEAVQLHLINIERYMRCVFLIIERIIASGSLQVRCILHALPYHAAYPDSI